MKMNKRQERSEVMQIQAKLEQVRAAAQSMPPVQAEDLTTRRTCVRCGESFDIMEKGLFRLPTTTDIPGATICRECWIEERNKIPSDHREQRAGFATPRTDILDRMDKLGINVRMHGRLTLSDMGHGPGRDAAMEFIDAFLSSGKYEPTTGLYIHGITGTGKSQLAVSIIRQLLAVGSLHSNGVIYDRARALVTQIQDRYTTGKVDEFSEARARTRLWVYEDAGTEKLTPDAFRIVEDILDRREGHATIITSNLSRPKLVAQWGDVAIVDRFRSRLALFKSVELTGSDRRFQRA
jgi:chromosomal replication initiation ATPase DnaA